MNKQRLMNDILQGLLMTAIVALALPIPHLAFAAGDLAASATLVGGTELPPISQVVSGLFYLGGGAMMGAGALKLKDHAENPTQTPMRQGIARMGVGAALIGIPLFSQMAINTLGYGTTATKFTDFGLI